MITPLQGGIDPSQDQCRYWTEKRDKESWQRAVKIAGQHRSRARTRGRSTHFSASEWLQLCERFGFRCPLCGVAQGEIRLEQERGGILRPRTGAVIYLQPHHRLGLAEGGENTSENLLPLCGDCHSDIHDWIRFRIDTSPGWLDTQRSLCQRFSPGMLVVRQGKPGKPRDSPELNPNYRSSWSVGVVIASTLPTLIDRAVGPDFSRHLTDPFRYGLVVTQEQVAFWRAGQVQVQWKAAQENAMPDALDPERLHPLDEETALWYRKEWEQEQCCQAAGFAVGDLVRPKGSRRTCRCQVVKILPPDPVLLLPTRAIIQNLTVAKDRRTVFTTTLLPVNDGG